MRTALLAAAALFVGGALSAPIVDGKPFSPLRVTLAQAGDSRVRATVENVGGEQLRLLNVGTFLDRAPVRKFDLFLGDRRIPFQGAVPFVHPATFVADSFTTFAPHESHSFDYDLADSFDLLEPGTYTISSTGSIPSASGTVLSGRQVPFRSNTLRISILQQPESPLRRRWELVPDPGCSPQQAAALSVAMDAAALQARNAANDSLAGPPERFAAYFKTTDWETRTAVSARLSAVAAECGPSAPGTAKVTAFCADPDRWCRPGVIAVSFVQVSGVLACAAFFDLPIGKQPGECGGGNDQAETLIHEMTHQKAVWAPGTVDHAWADNDSRKLDAKKSLENADNWGLYAQAVAGNC